MYENSNKASLVVLLVTVPLFVIFMAWLLPRTSTYGWFVVERVEPVQAVERYEYRSKMIPAYLFGRISYRLGEPEWVLIDSTATSSEGDIPVCAEAVEPQVGDKCKTLVTEYLVFLEGQTNTWQTREMFEVGDVIMLVVQPDGTFGR